METQISSLSDEFTAIAYIAEPKEQHTGKYKCASTERPSVLSYFYIYIPGERTWHLYISSIEFAFPIHFWLKLSDSLATASLVVVLIVALVLIILQFRSKLVQRKFWKGPGYRFKRCTSSLHRFQPSRISVSNQASWGELQFPFPS